MIIYHRSLILLSIFYLPANSNDKFEVNDDKNAIDVDLHEKRFCTKSECSLINLDPSEYRDLRYQNCMCDEQCSQYGDCCRDSGFSVSKPSNVTCITTAKGDNLYMKTSCPSTWQKSANVKVYCENVESFDSKSDIPLFIPVTSRNNVTYGNLFCAICNGESTFDFWNVGIWGASNSSSNHSSVENSTLTSDFDNDILITGIIPSHLVDRVRYCVPNVINSCPPFWNDTTSCPEYTSYVYSSNRTFKNIECLLCNGENMTVTNETCHKSIEIHSKMQHVLVSEESLPTFFQSNKFCNEIPEQNSAFQILCLEAASDVKTNDCSSPEMCHINRIYDISNDDQVKIIDNDTVFVKYLNLELKNGANGTPEWIFINATTIFVCGINETADPNGFLNDVGVWLSNILIVLSIICLILHLVTFQQLPKLRNRPAKCLAAYSFSLLIAFLCLDLDEKWGLCKFTAVILHYSLLSSFVWMLLMSYDCWLGTYRATTKLRQKSKKKSRKFTWFTLIALFIPFFIVSLGVYLEYSSTKKIPCKWKPHYGSGGYCFIGATECFLALFIIPSSILFVINNILFACTAYLIYCNQRRNIVKKQERLNFKLYIRLSLIMGSTWIYGTLYTLTDWSIMQILFILFNMSQGIFIFVAFTLQKRNLKMLRSKYKNNRRIVWIFNWYLGEQIVPSDTTIESLRLR